MTRKLPSSSRRSLAVALALLAAVALAVVGIRSAPAGAGARPGATALETRLLAPCCFNGTLDTHESDLARTLRVEIEDRIAHGEASAEIEADLVARYGPKIRALPHEGALTTLLGAAALLAVAMAALLAVRMRRWRRSSDEHAAKDAKATPTTGARDADEYDARIDAELAEIE